MKQALKEYIKRYYEHLFEGTIKPSIELARGFSKLVELGYLEDPLCSFWNFPWDMAYPCGCPIHYLPTELPEGMILNLGCGIGIDTFYLIRLRDCDKVVINIDIVFSVLQQSKKWFMESSLSTKSVEWICAEGQALPLKSATFSSAILNGVFNLFEDKIAVLLELSRILVPEGIVLISDIFSYHPLEDSYTKEKDGWVWCISGAITLEILKKMLKETGFSGFSLHEQERIDNTFYRAVVSFRKLGV